MPRHLVVEGQIARDHSNSQLMRDSPVITSSDRPVGEVGFLPDRSCFETAARRSTACRVVPTRGLRHTFSAEFEAIGAHGFGDVLEQMLARHATKARTTHLFMNRRLKCKSARFRNSSRRAPSLTPSPISMAVNDNTANIDADAETRSSCPAAYRHFVLASPLLNVDGATSRMACSCEFYGARQLHPSF